MLPSRFICTVLDEMRTCIKTLNFSYLESLIEEAQILANRMESSLDDVDCLERLRENVKDLETQKKSLRKEIKEVGEKPVVDRW